MNAIVYIGAAAVTLPVLHFWWARRYARLKADHDYMRQRRDRCVYPCVWMWNRVFEL